MSTNSDSDEENPIVIPKLECNMADIEYKEYQDITSQSLKGPLENVDDFRAKYCKDKIFKMVEQGLFYSSRLKMPILRDNECKMKSRCYLTKVLIDFGADPNVHSPEMLHTPLHWLAFWGDHRAVRILLQLNRIDFIQPKVGCMDNKSDKQK